MKSEPKVDLTFKIVGKSLPVDHGFALYAGVGRVLPFIHEDCELGVRLIRGRYIGGGVLDVSPHSELVLRVPAGEIARYLPLTGKTLHVLGHDLAVGVPTVMPLVPAAALYAQLVTTKNGHDQERFEAEARKQMAAGGVNGGFSVGKRRTFEIHGKKVVGYSMLVSGLNAGESIALQERGIGGRRKMGCGFFEAWKG